MNTEPVVTLKVGDRVTITARPRYMTDFYPVVGHKVGDTGSVIRRLDAWGDVVVLFDDGSHTHVGAKYLTATPRTTLICRDFRSFLGGVEIHALVNPSTSNNRSPS